MSKPIPNPLLWSVTTAQDAGAHAAQTAKRIGGENAGPIADEKIRKLTIADLRYALRQGYDDLAAARGDVMALVVVYPLIGFLLAALTLNYELLPLLFPLFSGFALLGPVAAIGLYEISRRREKGLTYSWANAFELIHAPAFGAILMLGFYHIAIFVIWMLSAQAIFAMTMGSTDAAGPIAFIFEVMTEPAGWVMFVVGCGVGFLFALLVLATSVVSFPLLLDRDIGVPSAIATSWKVFRKNTTVICCWGVIVVVGLALGTLPALIGLVFTLPLLGHATWHLYRRAIAD